MCCTGTKSQLIVGFLTTVFEFASLGYFSTIPANVVVNTYFGNIDHADVPNGWNGLHNLQTVGLLIFLAYLAWLALVLCAYLWVFIQEMVYIGSCQCCRGCQDTCTRCCTKSCLLSLVLLPILCPVVVFFIYIDCTELINEWPEVRTAFSDDSDQAAEAALDSFLTHVALTLGDVLLLKHVMTKLSNLWSRDFNVSLFVEGHAHLDGSHVKHVIGAHHSINDYPEDLESLGHLDRSGTDTDPLLGGRRDSSAPTATVYDDAAPRGPVAVVGSPTVLPLDDDDDQVHLMGLAATPDRPDNKIWNVIEKR